VYSRGWYLRPLRQASRHRRFRNRRAAHGPHRSGRRLRLLERITAIGARTYPLPFAPFADAGYDIDLRDPARILASRKARLAETAIEQGICRRKLDNMAFAVAHQPTQPFDGGRTVRTGDFPHLALLGVNLLATAAITAAPAFFPHFSPACGWRR
jgi:hypothetical protein